MRSKRRGAGTSQSRPGRRRTGGTDSCTGAGGVELLGKGWPKEPYYIGNCSKLVFQSKIYSYKFKSFKIGGCVIFKVAM